MGGLAKRGAPARYGPILTQPWCRSRLGAAKQAKRTPLHPSSLTSNWYKTGSPQPPASARQRPLQVTTQPGRTVATAHTESSTISQSPSHHMPSCHDHRPCDLLLSKVSTVQYKGLVLRRSNALRLPGWQQPSVLLVKVRW